VVRLEQLAMTYGAERRRLRVHKMRGRKFHGGYHDFVIRSGGLDIFPRLVAADHPDAFLDLKQGTSGVRELDDLVGGGLDYGTATLIIGPSGTGKSTLGLCYAYEAARNGEKVLVISFDETRTVFERRANGLGMETAELARDERFIFKQVDPAELSPGELTGMIREQVEGGVTVVVLDSLSGYQQAMPEEQFLLLQMHEILTYLNQQNVLTLLILTQAGMIGQMQNPLDLTYLSDTVLLLRYFETDGEIRRAVSAVKKRTGRHESSIREFQIADGGVHVGPRLNGFRGVLTGVPVYEGHEELMKSKTAS
jgi:circadian clock protein KaiC